MGTNIVRSLHSNKLYLTIVAVVLALAYEGPQRLLAQQDASQEVERAIEHLRWKFVPDEVIRVKMFSTNRTVGQHDKHTESTYEYRWKVEEVDSSGTAILALHFDRARFRHRSNDLDFRFDSSNVADGDATHDDPTVEWLLTFNRNLVSSEFRIKVTELGEVEDVTRPESESSFTPRAFTPAFWPILPHEHVSPGDTWTSRDDGDSLTEYKLARVEQVVDRVLLHIVSDGELSRFDVKAGRFIDKAMRFGSRIETASGEFDTNLQEFRLRLFPSAGWSETSSQSLAQLIEPSDKWRYFGKSFTFAPQIDEHLMNERGLLQAILLRFFTEIATPQEMPEPSGDLSGADWLMAARIYERAGDIAKSKWASHKALASAKSVTPAIYKATHLLRVTEALARVGDTKGATQAALAIHRSAGTNALNVTEQGPIDIPTGAIQGYALLLLTSKQAEAGNYKQCSATAEMIANENTKAAAYWLIAMRQAEQGDLASAEKTAKLANEASPLAHQPSQKNPQLVLEYTHKGPRAIQLNAYRTLALSSIATRLSLTGDQKGAAESLEQIGVPALRNAAIVELVHTLAQHGKNDLAENWVQSLRGNEFFHSAALYNKAKIQLEKGDLQSAIKSAESIRTATFRSKLLVEICNRLADVGDRTGLLNQIALASQAVASIEEPVMRAEALWELSSIQLRAEKVESARHHLQLAQRLIEKSIEDPVARARALSEVAGRVHAAGLTEEAKAMLRGVLEQSRKLDEFTQASSILAVVQQQLKIDLVKSAEAQAHSIPLAAMRCQALAAVAQRYADELELEKSRELFGEAFASAEQVSDVLGLDTPYSKGGAIRQVARTQGRCDISGLSAYLESAKSANVKAYGYLGAAETVAPAASRRVESRGSDFPEGLLHTLWSPRVLARVVKPN